MNSVIYEECPKCHKKGLHELALNDYNNLMRQDVEGECKYCGYVKLKEFAKDKKRRTRVNGKDYN